MQNNTNITYPISIKHKFTHEKLRIPKNHSIKSLLSKTEISFLGGFVKTSRKWFYENQTLEISFYKIQFHGDTWEKWFEKMSHVDSISTLKELFR